MNCLILSTLAVKENRNYKKCAEQRDTTSFLLIAFWVNKDYSRR